MAAFTISTNTNYDALTSPAGNDTYTINSGAVLTIDTDTRYCNNHTLTTGNLGNVTITAATGGEIKFDGTNVKLIPYNSGASGNVPAINSTVTQGSVSATFLGLWTSLATTPTAAGTATPASGFVKVKGVTGGNFTATTINGASSFAVTAASAEKTGWIEVIGCEGVGIGSSTAINRLGTVRYTGSWFNAFDTAGTVYTTSGVRNQTIQLPACQANTYYAGVWIEKSASSGTYEFWPNAGTLVATTTPTDIRGRLVWISSQGLLRIGNDGTNAVGELPASGLNVRAPNINTINVVTTSMQTNAVPNATLATRYDYTMTSGGSFYMDKTNLAWYPSLSQAYAVEITNSAIHEAINLNEIATEIIFTDSGVGMTAAQSQVPLTATSCFAGATITDSKFIRSTGAGNGIYIISLTNITGWDFTRVTAQGLINRSSTTSGVYTVTNALDCTWTDCINLGGKMLMTTCTNCTFTDTSYIDQFSTTTPTTTGQYVAVFQTKCNNMVFSGLDFAGLTNVHPRAGLINIIASDNIKVRNIGTYLSPLNLGSANACATLAVFGGNGSLFEFKRIYTANAGGTFTTVNSDTKILLQNVFADYADTFTSIGLNTQVKGCGWTFVTTGQTAVYGTHFEDIFTSTTSGWIVIHANEKTVQSYSASAYTVVTGSPQFNSAGGVQMPLLDQEIVWETPYWVIGHTSFVNSAATVSGTNTAASAAPVYTNFTLYYQLDKNDGNGYPGSWTGLTGPNLSGETGIDASLGFKMKIRAVVTTAATTNAIVCIRMATNSTTGTQAYQYPLDLATITLSNVVVGSRYEIYNVTSSTTLATGTAASSTVAIEAAASNGDSIRVRVRKSSAATKYIPFSTLGTVASLALNVYVSQIADTIVT